MRLILLAAALFAAPAAAQSYVMALEGRALVEGLGFEGVLTVYDETPRMYRLLGQPRTEADKPEWYFYDDGPLALTVQAEYRDEKFHVRSIRYANDKQRRLATNTGIRLGDPVARVVDAVGEAEVIEAGAWDYPSRGVTYHVGPRSTVVAITVYRPSSQGTPSPAAPRDEPKAPQPARPVTLTDLGLVVTVSEDWQVTEPIGPLGGALELPGVAALRVTACTECAEIVEQAVRDFEKDHGQNRLPEAMRRLSGEALARRGADEVYQGRYAAREGAPSTWLFALRREQRYYLATVELESMDLSQPAAAAVADLLLSLKLIPAATEGSP